ncbi:putative outer membrane efflux protein [Helicobacter mustelae]|nr:putative outer membrane efflux protein [Helicobacter mustelae]STP14201.1 putative outer membrane efflux protein [Helicobacter mustelae]
MEEKKNKKKQDSAQRAKKDAEKEIKKARKKIEKEARKRAKEEAKKEKTQERESKWAGFFGTKKDKDDKKSADEAPKTKGEKPKESKKDKKQKRLLVPEIEHLKIELNPKKEEEKQENKEEVKKLQEPKEEKKAQKEDREEKEKESKKDKKKSKKRKKGFLKFLLFLLGIGIIIWLSVTFYRAYLPKPLRLQGQITAREYSLSSKLAGRVENLKVKKGDMVQKGELIYQIHSPEVEAKLAQAQASYEAAKAISQETSKGARDETIISAKDVYSSAKTMTELAKKTYDRLEGLYKNGVVSLQKRDEAYAAYQSAKYRENVAYQQYKIALDGARDETKKAAFEKQKAAQGQVSEVEAYIKDINVYAPISGEVSNVLLHDGELSPSGFPVVLLVDTKDVWLRLSINEQYLSKFQKDAVFEGYIPALDKTIKFKVNYVSVMGDFATWKATSSGKGYDMKSYEIDAVPLEEIEGWRMGMSVLVEVP